MRDAGADQCSCAGEAPSLRDSVESEIGLFPTLKREANERCAYGAGVVVGPACCSHPKPQKRGLGWGTRRDIPPSPRLRRDRGDTHICQADYLRELMSMTKRYFTSCLSMRSKASLICWMGMTSTSAVMLFFPQ
jgi:hypothetical protein